MSLAGYQDALARWLVDADLRGRGAVDEPDALAPDEREGLAALDREAVERVARSLRRKRVRAVTGTVPHATRLWPGLADAYLGLLERRPATVADLDPRVGPGASELLRLLAPLVDAARVDPEAPVWTADLLRLELARACVRLAGGVRALRCQYPVHELLFACDEGWLGVVVEAHPHAYRLEPGLLRWRAMGAGE